MNTWKILEQWAYTGTHISILVCDVLKKNDHCAWTTNLDIWMQYLTASVMAAKCHKWFLTVLLVKNHCSPPKESLQTSKQVQLPNPPPHMKDKTYFNSL